MNFSRIFKVYGFYFIKTKKFNVNKLHFIGEATSTYTGTVHGAYQSGLAAAKLISASIKNKC